MVDALSIKVEPSQELTDLVDGLKEHTKRKIKVCQTKSIGLLSVETYVEAEYTYDDHIETAYMIKEILGENDYE